LKEIYNGAWEPNWGFVKMTDEEFDFLAADLKQIAEPDFTFIAEIDGKPADLCLPCQILMFASNITNQVVC
jgi:hypothetical protein